jgi:hypothetical protein
MKKRKDRSWC